MKNYCNFQLKDYQKKVIFIIICIASVIWAYNSLLDEQKANEELTKFTSSYEIGTDGYCIDKILYEHPSWSYNQAEEYLFGKPNQ